MASDTPQPPEGFDTFEPNGGTDDDDVERIELSGGEVLNGLVLDLTEGENENGSWYLLTVKDDSRGVVKYFAKGDAKAAASSGNIEIGEPIYVYTETEETSFETDDGETKSYYPTHVAFPSEGDA